MSTPPAGVAASLAPGFPVLSASGPHARGKAGDQALIPQTPQLMWLVVR